MEELVVNDMDDINVEQEVVIANPDVETDLGELIIENDENEMVAHLDGNRRK